VIPLFFPEGKLEARANNQLQQAVNRASLFEWNTSV